MGVVGDVRGRHYTSVVAPEDTRRARELFTQKVMGTVEVTDSEGVFIDGSGKRISVEISPVSLRQGGRIIGVFGQFFEAPLVPAPPLQDLTPRQNEVLRMLERGCSSKQIADELGISKDTVRNHVREVLRVMGASFRLEAVAISHARSRAEIGS
jgi:DNA-binding CsgD family transcriptional regulator